MGVTIGNSNSQRRFIGGFMRREPAALVHTFVPLEDARVSNRILRLSATSRLYFLPRTLPPEMNRQTAEEYDALLEWRPALNTAGG